MHESAMNTKKAWLVVFCSGIAHATLFCLIKLIFIFYSLLAISESAVKSTFVAISYIRLVLH